MNTAIVMEPQAKVKNSRFVAKSEYAQGQYNYRHGLPLSTCGSDEMAAGWLACEPHERFGWMRSADAKGADAYWRAQMADASAVKCVNWGSVGDF